MSIQFTQIVCRKIRSLEQIKLAIYFVKQIWIWQPSHWRQQVSFKLYLLSPLEGVWYNKDNEAIHALQLSRTQHSKAQHSQLFYLVLCSFPLCPLRCSRQFNKNPWCAVDWAMASIWPVFLLPDLPVLNEQTVTFRKPIHFCHMA